MKECPLCRGAYSPRGIVVIEEADDNRLVHVTCPKCRVSLVAVVAVSPLGMSTVGMLTDLSAGDLKRLANRSAIAADDILAFHQCLHQQEFHL